MDRKQLMSDIKKGRAELEAVLEKIGPDRLEQTLPNGWTGKDALAHIEFWERRVASLFNMLRGGAATEWDEADETVMNDRVYRENLHRSLADVRQSEQAAYRDLLAMVERADDAELFDPNHFAWTEGHPFAGWIEGNMHGHYEEHLVDLRKLLA